MTRKAAQTGPGAMVLVAIEQYCPEGERILTDDLAHRILPVGFRLEVRLLGPLKDWVIRKSEQKVPGLWGGIMARKRYIDDQVAEAADRVEAVVNLGAGFDTRAFRLEAMADAGGHGNRADGVGGEGVGRANVGNHDGWDAEV